MIGNLLVHRLASGFFFGTAHGFVAHKLLELFTHLQQLGVFSQALGRIFRAKTFIFGYSFFTRLSELRDSLRFSLKCSLGGGISFASTTFQVANEIVNFLTLSGHLIRMIFTSAFFLSAEIFFSSLFCLEFSLESFTTSKLGGPRSVFVGAHLCNAFFLGVATSVFLGHLLSLGFRSSTNNIFRFFSSSIFSGATSLFFCVATRLFAIPIGTALIFTSSSACLVFFATTKLVSCAGSAILLRNDSTLERFFSRATLAFLRATFILGLHT